MAINICEGAASAGERGFDSIDNCKSLADLNVNVNEVINNRSADDDHEETILKKVQDECQATEGAL